MSRQNNPFSRFLFLAVFALGLLLPSRFVFAENTRICSCYTKNNDCISSLNTSAYKQKCELDCKTVHKDQYQSATFASGDNVAAEHAKCLQTHAILTNTEIATSPSTSKQPIQFISPTLNVQIPGLTKFTDAASGPCSYDKSQTCIKSTFLAEYLTALYRFLIGASITIAIIMLMIGGFQYVLSAGGSDAGKAKTRIQNATIGLVLLLSVYLILYTRGLYLHYNLLYHIFVTILKTKRCADWHSSSNM